MDTKIIEIDFPEQSLLFSGYKKYHYTDCFQGSVFYQGNAITPTQVTNAFFLSIPGFAQVLLSLRNKITSLFGLKPSGDADKINEADSRIYNKGDQLGQLTVFDINPNELVFGMDDKHLDFRGSLLLEHTKDDMLNVTILTVVSCNNWFGRFYFSLIKPLHKVIMKYMLKGALKKLTLPVN